MKKSLWINLKKTWVFTKKQKRYLVAFIILSFISSLMMSIIPILYGRQVLSMSNGLFENLIQISLIILGVEIVREIIWYLLGKASQIFFRETLISLQTKIANEVLNLKTSTFDNNSSGVFIERLSKDASDIADVFQLSFDTLSKIITNFGILFAVFIVNKIIFCYFAIMLLVIFWLKKVRIQKHYEREKEYRELNEDNTSIISEMVRGIRDIKVLNANDNFLKIMADKLINSNKKRYSIFRVLRIFNFLNGIVSNIFSIGFIFLAIYLTKNNSLSIANFVVLFVYQPTLLMLVEYIAGFVENMKKFDLSANRFFEIFDGDNYQKEIFGTEELPKINGDFEFKNVSFSYKDNEKVLNNISFKVEANHTVAFIGKSGSGKTTIFSLLTKLYDIQEGEILIDGKNINNLTKNSIRNNISLITQMPHIFNFSIKNNLQMVNPNATEEETINACKAACLHDFILTLPDGYETLMGEGGIILSGGQRQRLAIARALLKKTEIILFDEATSSLDNETQKEIQIAIENLRNKYTILIIAHRLSTVIAADKIIVIDQGKVIAKGKHDELYKSCELYQNLYKNELNN